MRQLPIHHDLETDQSPSQKHIVLVDSDIGDDIDDALALALVLQSPEIELQGVTTVFGDTRLRARLAAHVLKVFGREDVPVAAGMEEPIQYRHRPSGVPLAALLQRYTEVLSQVNIALNQQIESIKSSIFPNTAVGRCKSSVVVLCTVSHSQKPPRLAAKTAPG